MTGALQAWLQATAPARVSDVSWPTQLRGRLVSFVQNGFTMGRPGYAVYSVRGGFLLGEIEFRNQWQMFSFIAAPSHDVTPMNKVMIAEIYAMLKELDGR